MDSWALLWNRNGCRSTSNVRYIHRERSRRRLQEPRPIDIFDDQSSRRFVACVHGGPVFNANQYTFLYIVLPWSGRAYSFVIEIAGSVGLIQPMHHTAHDGQLWYFPSDLVSCLKINLKFCRVLTQEITWAIRKIILCVWQEISEKRNRGPVAKVGELKIIWSTFRWCEQDRVRRRLKMRVVYNRYVLGGMIPGLFFCRSRSWISFTFSSQSRAIHYGRCHLRSRS